MKSEQINSHNKGFSNRLLHGDCIELLSSMASNHVDFVLTDPPYLANYLARDGRTVPNDNGSDWVKPAFHEIYRVLDWNRFCVSLYGWHKADKFLAAWREVGFRVIGHLTFIKHYASTERFLRYQHENAYLLAKGNPQKPARTIPDSWNGNIRATTFIRLRSLSTSLRHWLNRSQIRATWFSTPSVVQAQRS